MRTTTNRRARGDPAAVRTRAGLRAGAELDVHVDDGAIRLVRMVSHPTPVRAGKRGLVARPTADPSHLPAGDVATLVEEEWPP